MHKNRVSSAKALFFALLFACFLLRLIAAFVWPAGIDEAYAISISRDWSLSYFDHPPLTFWITRAVEQITGRHDASLIRIPFVLMGTISAWLVYDITLKSYGRLAAVWGLAWYSVAPFFLLSGGLFIVPDGPLNLALLATVRLLLPNILSCSKKISLPRSVAIGVCYSLALISKYQAIALLISLVGFVLLASHGSRDWLRSRNLLIATLPLCLLAFLPVVAWNSSHNWISFGFQAGRAGTASLSIQPDNFMATLVGQIFYLLPGTWLVMVICALQGLRRPRCIADSLFAWLTLVQPFCFLLLALVSQRSLPHWAMSGYLFGFPLVGAWTAEFIKLRPKLIRQVWTASASVIALAAIAVGLQFRNAFFTRIFAPDTLRLDSDWQLQDWTALEDAWAELGSPKTVLTRSWLVGGKVGHAIGGQVQIVPLLDPRHFQFFKAPDVTEMIAVEPARPGEFATAAELFKEFLVAKGFTVVGPPRRTIQKSAGYTRFEIISFSVKK